MRKGCKFDKPWEGRCGSTVVEGHDSCSEHYQLLCCECRYPATQGCDNAGSLICGAPLCDQCTHLSHLRGNTKYYFSRIEALKKHYDEDVRAAKEQHKEDNARYVEVKASNRRVKG